MPQEDRSSLALVGSPLSQLFLWHDASPRGWGPGLTGSQRDEDCDVWAPWGQGGLVSHVTAAQMPQLEVKSDPM